MSTRPAIDISLYGIIDPARCRNRPLDAMVRDAVAGGVTLLQYRDKTSDTATLVANARLIRSAIADSGVPLLINDRIDVAMAAGAHGVHIGQSDMAVEDARALLGERAIIGLTVKTAQQAQQVPVDLIDYACIGGVYDTLSKDNPTAIGLDGWQAAAAPLRARAPAFPVGAIAGIDAANAASVIAAGADGVAIISGIFMQDDVRSATQTLSNIIQAARA